MKRGAIFQFILFIPLLAIANAGADPRPVGESGLPLPRFVSIAQSEANMRRGPGGQYPLIWQYTRRGWPLEIIAEHGRWRQIRDHEGTKGWMHARLLRGKRTIIIRPQVHHQALALRTRPQADAGTVALVQMGVVGQLEKCRGNWCAVILGDYDGWLPRTQLWGVYDFEFSDK